MPLNDVERLTYLYEIVNACPSQSEVTQAIRDIADIAHDNPEAAKAYAERQQPAAPPQKTWRPEEQLSPKTHTDISDELDRAIG